ncbi:hypothetical protein DCO48_00435 [Pseudomonas sp. SDI]|uniref:hypothetical protein n=1 Tax=Pseudomonas sp. SDI TaxID=2170734 RepID=UPI000DE6635D|nr:hypothetical protein [Pseudomonas sp. SDI]PWB35952.1 hypothetical protein DCO48_00435 [Pseudomonas sp. SDI]
MPYRARRRALRVTFNPVSLIVSVAVGLWLGAVAIGVSLWLLGQYLPQVQQPLRDAIAPPAAPVAPVAPAPYGAAEQTPEQNRMFEQYQQILRQQQVEHAEQQMQGDPRNLSKPACQFWLQQNRTAPTEKSRANVLEFCH